MISPEVPTRLSTLLITRIAALILNIWFSTCKITIVGQQFHDRFILGNQRMVGATWHRGAIFLTWFFRNVHPMIMYSRSKDGDLIAAMAHYLGVIPVRGSSSKGGGEALRKMARFLSRSNRNKAATVLDGPRGPKGVAKKGMLLLAMIAKAPLLPIMVSAHPAITLKNTWDKTILPLPFSKVVVMYKTPWWPPRRMPDAELEIFRKQVEESLNQMQIECDQLSGYTKRNKKWDL
jgi:lysophospholipid acyltransferase (LPLAT)-like uncharacterized protein